MRAAKVLSSLRVGADSPEPSLFENAVSTKSSWAGSYGSFMLFLSFYAFMHVCLLMPCGHLLGKG